MSDLKIYKYTLPKKTLELIPEEERAFLIYAGHIANELNWLNRITLTLQRKGNQLLQQSKDDSSLETKAIFDGNAIQTVICWRMLTAKARDASRFLDENISKAEWHKKIRAKFNEKGKKSWRWYLRRKKKLSKLKNTKSLNKDPLHLMRNNFAAHYSPEAYQLARRTDLLPRDFTFYLSEINGTTLYYGCDLIVTRIFTELLSPGQYRRSLDRWISQSSVAAGALQDIMGQSMAQILEQHAFKPDKKTVVRLILKNVPDFESISLPFFVYPPREKKGNK